MSKSQWLACMSELRLLLIGLDCCTSQQKVLPLAANDDFVNYVTETVDRCSLSAASHSD